MTRKRKVRFTRVISDVAINSVVRFPRRSGLYKVIAKGDSLNFLEKVERNPQISFVSLSCVVYIVEGF